MTKPLSWVLALVLAVSACGVDAPPPETSRRSGARPNVLLVSIDTLRADHVGTYGGTAAQTPALDGLAAKGVVFEKAVSHVAVTLPSHASIFTSRTPPSHGVRDNATYRLEPSQTSLAEVLQDAGYATAGFVGAFVLDSRFGLEQGFDVYDDSMGESEDAERRAEEVLRSAAAWIEGAEPGAPWFAFVHLFDPHAPYQPVEPFAARYRDNPYAGEVAYVDHALAELLSKLRSAGMLEDTLVVVTSDHGEGLGEHGERTHGMFAYDSTLHVPLVLSWPSGLPAGRRVSERVRLMDVAPTVVELAGLSPPESFEGRSLVGLIEGRDDSGDRTSYFEALTYAFNRGTAPLFGLYRNEYKFISVPLPELYDLSADPGETENLVSQRAGTVSEMADTLATMVGGLDPAATAGPELDADALERLQSLGYIIAPKALPRSLDEYGPDDDPKRWVHLANKLDDAVNHHRAGRLAEAEQLLREILDERPLVPTAHARLARILDEEGRRSDAVDVLEEAFRRGVRAPSVVHLLGRYLTEGGRTDRWIQVLDAVVKESPEDADAREALASHLARTGRLREAVPHLEALAALRPEDAAAQANLGLAYLEIGDMPRAEARLSRAVARDPSLATAWTALGDVYASRGQAEPAIDAWSRAVEADERQYETMVRLGLALADAGRPDEALTYLERFVASAPAGVYGEEKRQVSALAEAIRSDLQ